MGKELDSVTLDMFTPTLRNIEARSFHLERVVYNCHLSILQDALVQALEVHAVQNLVKISFPLVLHSWLASLKARETYTTTKTGVTKVVTVFVIASIAATSIPMVILETTRLVTNLRQVSMAVLRSMSRVIAMV